MNVFGKSKNSGESSSPTVSDAQSGDNSATESYYDLDDMEEMEADMLAREEQYAQNTVNSQRDDTEMAEDASKQHELFELVKCKEIGERLGQCYAANKGLYGCERFMEEFDQCRRVEIHAQMKQKSDKEWLAFREQFLQKKRERMREQIVDKLHKDTQKSKWFT